MDNKQLTMGNNPQIRSVRLQAGRRRFENRLPIVYCQLSIGFLIIAPLLNLLVD